MRGKSSVTFGHSPAMFFAAHMRSPVPKATLRILAGLCLSLGVASAGFGQVPAARTKAEVRTVRFALVNAPETTARWFEADVELDVRQPGGRTTYVDRVKVALSLGVKSLDGSYRFYRAEVEAVSVEAGAAHFRFYLPPEIVRRDGLRPDAEFWLVEISAAGEVQPVSIHSYTTTLREPERLKNFQGKITGEAPAHDGEFVPQSFTPFAGLYGGASPTMLRKSRE